MRTSDCFTLFASATLAALLATGIQSRVAAASSPPDSWYITPTPNPAPSDSFNAVSCVNAEFCVAVGSYVGPSKTGRTLTEEWNGTSWRTIPSPDEGSGDNSLNGVSCFSPHDCFAVGSGFGAQYEEGIILNFDGHSWSVASVLSSVHGVFSFNSVSCPSSDFCAAVGRAANDGGVQSVVETWNGSRWKAANASTLNLTLTGVSCASARFCAAVGNGRGNPYAEGVILVLEGASWSQSAVLSSSHGEYTLGGVSCASAHFCQAVGRLGNDGGIFTVVDTWNGTSWVQPETGTIRGAVLSAVDCTTKSNCIAAGDSTQVQTSVDQSLIESWDGSSWTETSTPDKGANANELRGVSCSGGAPDCIAVGLFNKASKHHTLALASYKDSRKTLALLKNL